MIEMLLTSLGEIIFIPLVIIGAMALSVVPIAAGALIAKVVLALKRDQRV